MVKEFVEQSLALRHNGVVVRELTYLCIDRSTLWNNSVNINVLSKLKVRGALRRSVVMLKDTVQSV